MSNAGTPVGTATVYRQLDKLVELGAIDEEEVKKCSSVRLKSSYYKLTEK